MMPLDNPYQITTAATVVTTTFPPSTTTPPSSTTTTTSSSSTTTTTTTSSASTTTTATTSSTTTTTTKYLLSSTPGNGAVEPKAVINARNLYKSCINETNIEIDDVELVLSIINTELGGWPILQGVSWNVSTFNLSNFLLKLRKYDNEIAFSVAIATDKKNASVYDIGVRNNTCLTFF
ncbi:unnamed protein product [Rotaria sp. Silwood2]|nr:unnamed protein product [Rotaria sp. Silwood2]CAF4296793.1 unnamed protein product [Rotaria sp. Silwood2]